MKFNKKFFALFMMLLLIEIIIALYIRDAIVRPYIGDILVIILMYSFIRSFTNRIKYLEIWLLVFSVSIEFVQYFNVVELIGLENNRFVSIIIGTTFDIKDIICYVIGTTIIVLLKRIKVISS